MDNMFQVYIIRSIKWNRFYTGMTNHFERRLDQHNNGFNKSTKNGTPWELVWLSAFFDKQTAASLEKKIKKRGAKRYLESL